MSTSVEALFAPFPHVRLAQSADQRPLREFHRSIAMKTNALSLAYDYANALADPTEFVSLFEDEGRIQGTATLACREARSESGEVVPYGYLANLRIAPKMSAGVRREWRRFYGALVAQAPDLEVAGRPRFMLTAILDDNVAAIRFLTKHLREVTYRPVQRYESVTTFGPTSLARTAVAGVLIRPATPDDELGARAITIAKGLSGANAAFDASHTVLAVRDGRIVAAVTVRHTPNRTLMITEASRPMRWLLRALRWLGVCRIDVPGPVRMAYLTDVRLSPALSGRDRRGIFEAIASYAWHHLVKPSGAQAMCFASWPDFAAATYALPRWLAVRTAGTLYEVVPAGAPGSPVLAQGAAAGPLPFDLTNS